LKGTAALAAIAVAAMLGLIFASCGGSAATVEQAQEVAESEPAPQSTQTAEQPAAAAESLAAAAEAGNSQPPAAAQEAEAPEQQTRTEEAAAEAADAEQRAAAPEDSTVSAAGSNTQNGGAAAAEFMPVHTGRGSEPGGVQWETVRNDLDDTFTRSIVWRYAETGSYNYPMLILDYGCYEKERLIFLGEYNHLYHNSSREIKVVLRFDRDEPMDQVWRLGSTRGWVWRQLSDLLEFRFKNAERLVAQLHVVNQHGMLEEVTATFDLEGFFDTPVQDNIDHCGEY